MIAKKMQQKKKIARETKILKEGPAVKKGVKPGSFKTGRGREMFVVGIGASAGGLHSFERFFKKMPADSGIAFVLVSHLDPAHSSMIPELLQKVTDMKVTQARENMKVEPNRIYVIPPNKNLDIMKDVLYLETQPTAPGPRSPINHFFKSLAEDKRERAIGIVLSGMGSDGSAGVKAIKAVLGMVIVEEPSAAEYSAMPENAIRTGMADFILTRENMPEYLLRYARRAKTGFSATRRVKSEEAPQILNKVFLLLRSVTGHDFSSYKPTTILRRIERRMNVHQIGSLPNYIRYLQKTPYEVKLLFKELLIGVTSFFRDPGAFESLGNEILPAYFREKPDDYAVRLWVPGCSSGEEAYSLAILLRELMEKEGRFFTTQIFATDIDGDAIGTARKGFYPSSIAPDVGAERLKRFFSKENEGYRVDKGIREMLVFAEQDVMRDPPFTRLDLISCRNLLIYMNVELQKKLFPLFHFALREKGILFLGPSETIGSFMHLYASASKKWKIYTRRPGSRLTPQIDFPIPDPHMEGRLFGIRPFSKPALPQEVERLLLDHYTPPGVVINGRGDIVYFHGKTGGFLEPSPGRANMNIKDMAREGLKAVIMGMINRAIASKKSVVRRYVRIKSDGDFISADITVRPFRRTRNMEGLWMILFEKPVQSMESKASKIKGAKGSKEELRIKELEVELKNTRENLQATIEELETMNEELKSTNEEYQSTNEELKSANEELETSREELQSLNEELVTVNNELQQKNERLEQVRNEMKKFLDTMDIAVIILDQKLRVRSFTPQATRLVNLIESDVGRPLSDMSNNLEYDRFTGDVEQVLATGKEILVNVQSRSKNWYLMKVRKLEGERKEDSGVAISFVDISDLKDIEAQLKRVQAARKYAESIVAAVGEPMLILARDLKVISANPVFCKVFRTSKEETIGRFIYELNNGQWDIPELRDLLGKVLQEKMQLTNYKVELVLPKTGKKSLLLNACQVVEDDRGVDRILLAMREDTAR